MVGSVFKSGRPAHQQRPAVVSPVSPVPVCFRGPDAPLLVVGSGSDSTADSAVSAAVCAARDRAVELVGVPGEVGRARFVFVELSQVKTLSCAPVGSGFAAVVQAVPVYEDRLATVGSQESLFDAGST